MQPFALEQVRADAERSALRISGSVRFADATPLWASLRTLQAGAVRGQTLDFDMSSVELIDGGVIALLACLRTERLKTQRATSPES